jgi:uncharacterized repeat protein (TIGR01451 family)
MIGDRCTFPERAPVPLRLAGLLAVVTCLTAFPSLAANAPRTRVTSGAVSAPSIVDLPLQFEANQGQVDRRVRFLGRGDGYTVFLTPSEAVLARRDPSGAAAHVVRMRLVGGAADPKITGLVEGPGKVNDFRGKEPSRWRNNVATYGQVRYEDVYPGVDVVFYGRQGELEYDFVVSAGADPGLIRLAFQGSSPPRRDAQPITPVMAAAQPIIPMVAAEQGDLLLDLGGEKLRLSRPVLYQEGSGSRRSVAGDFVIGSTGEVGFRIGAYDASRPLVIDPVLSYSTYLGGSARDSATGVAVDEAGNVYLTGSTYSLDFPTPGGAYPTPQGSLAQSGTSLDGPDVFVTKFRRGHWPDSSELVPVYSTYLGGETTDLAAGIAVDADGNAYVTGQTFSQSFPTYPEIHPTPPIGFECEPACPFQVVNRGYSDAFVTKLDPSGALVYSTYLGGWFYDGARAIAVDSAGNAHVVGYTFSDDLRLENSNQPYRGDGDAFVAKLNANGSRLLFSTYLGGGGPDEATAVAVRSYLVPTLPPCCRAVTATLVAGTTSSADFPVTADAAQNGNRGHAFVVRFAPAGGIVYATRVGGGGESRETATGVAIDTAANAYVTGFTDSPVFPTRNPVQAGLAWGPDAFVTRLNATGNALVYSTYLGGLGPDEATGIAVDASGNAFVTGSTSSTNFPAVRPLRGFAGLTDAFATALAPDGTLTYSGPVGGSRVDRGNAIAIGAGNDVFIAGETGSSNFPQPRPGLGGSAAWDPDCGTAASPCSGSFPPPDAFLVKIRDLRSGSSDLRVSVSGAPDPVGPGDTLTYAVTVENTTGQAATDVSVVQQLSPEVHVASVTPAERCFESAKTVYCNFPSVAASGSVQVVVEVNVNNAPQ